MQCDHSPANVCFAIVQCGVFFRSQGFSSPRRGRAGKALGTLDNERFDENPLSTDQTWLSWIFSRSIPRKLSWS